MKTRILILILLIISISLNATKPSFYSHQNTVKKEKWIKLGMYISSSILIGVGNGLMDKGYDLEGGLVSIIGVGVFFLTSYVVEIDKSEWLTELAEYGFICIGTSSYARNLTRGKPLNYGGTNPFSNQGIKQGTDFWPVARGVFLGIGIKINFTDFR